MQRGKQWTVNQLIVEVVASCHRATVRGRAFLVAGAKVWNGLPNDVTSASSLTVFNSDGTIYRIVSNIAILRSYRGISLSR